VLAAQTSAPVPKMATVTLPTAILSGTTAAAGIAWINSIGSLGGYIGPTIFGALKDGMGNDIYAAIFLAMLSAVACGLVLIIWHDARTEQAAPGRA
jgi:nitrate/nitrite transporter NarK